MKHGTEYARKIRRLFARLKRQYGKPEPDEPPEPVDQLLFGILHRGTTVARAERALSKLRSTMVDLNELRVSTPSELVALLGPGFPHATEKAKAVVTALNQIFERYHDLKLDPLRSETKREARRYLDGLDGVDPATAAGVMLFTLEGHAVPVDENTLTVLRADGLVDPNADVVEVQAFLERNISAKNACAFTTLLRRHSEERIKRLGTSGASARSAKRSGRATKGAAASKKRRRPVSVKARKATGPGKSRSAGGSSRSRRASTKGRRLSTRAGKRRSTSGKRRTRTRSAAKSR